MGSSNEDMFYDTLESEYKQSLPYYRGYEEMILSSFSKEDLKNEIAFQKNILKAEQVCYENKSQKFKKVQGKVDEIGKYFIDKYCEIFYGESVKQMKKYIQKLEYYYKRHHVKFVPNSMYKKPPIDISEIPILDVIGRYMDMKGGTRRNIRCGFHRDIHPSFRIYPDTNSWYCFSCGRGGNPVTFVALIENISNKEAYRMLQELYN